MNNCFSYKAVHFTLVYVCMKGGLLVLQRVTFFNQALKRETFNTLLF